MVDTISEVQVNWEVVSQTLFVITEIKVEKLVAFLHIKIFTADF